MFNVKNKYMSSSVATDVMKLMMEAFAAPAHLHFQIESTMRLGLLRKFTIRCCLMGGINMDMERGAASMQPRRMKQGSFSLDRALDHEPDMAILLKVFATYVDESGGEFEELYDGRCALYDYGGVVLVYVPTCFIGSLN
ncbi:hypothetical protein M8C21_029267 [Ambrosia artemisiifolia]|uniref:Uncharacterized protein n=1 Tax=Ambrosia artemisiifolia TaxID=4212 RepID=A0AAD5GK72_AMBAR|nr:hypothetical protein M8C21_029267 [Ambrosia artemisiifolia]